MAKETKTTRRIARFSIAHSRCSLCFAEVSQAGRAHASAGLFRRMKQALLLAANYD
jgi:hypothetical protein